MNTLKRLLPLSLAVVAASQATATDYVLRNGSVLSGYIAEQPTTPGELMTIATTNAIVVKDADELDGTLDPEFMPRELLKPEWVEWAEKNNGWNYNEYGEEGLYFDKPEFTDGTGLDNGAHVVSTGRRMVFVELTPNVYRVAPADIARWTDTPLPHDATAGLLRSYTLDDQLVSGDLVETIPGRMISVRTARGINTTFSPRDIRTMEMVRINPDKSYMEQSPVIDEIDLKDGRTLTGVIVAQDFEGRTIILETADGSTATVQIADIEKYNRSLNNAMLDPNDNSAELLNAHAVVNNMILPEGLGMAQSGEYFYLTPTADAESYFVTVEKASASTLELTLRFNDSSTRLAYFLVPLTEMEERRIPDLRNTDEPNRIVYTSLEDDMEVNLIGATNQEETGPNTAQLTFKMPRKGLYAIYNPTNGETFAIRVK